jgi:hypothetical protein
MQQTEQRQARGTIVSKSPGRVRVRLHHQSRRPRLTQRIQEGLAGRPGIEDVDVNPRTGSVAVRYDRGALSFDDVCAIIDDLGVILESLDEPPDLSDLAAHPGRSTVARDIAGAVDRIDKRLARATGRTVDLRLLFPVGLFALGVRQIFVEGLGLTQVPGYILLWYAFDAFWKLHRDIPNAPATGDSGGAGTANGVPTGKTDRAGATSG